MKFFTELHKEPSGNEWWVESGMKDPSYKESGVVAIGKTAATTLRKAARNLERESKRLFEMAEKVEKANSKA
jgi:hypothetical protein